MFRVLTFRVLYFWISQSKGYHFGDPHNEDYSILGSTLGYTNFGKLPFRGLRVELWG